MTAMLTGVTEVAVRTALDSVVDPELDEAITDLGFVRSVTVQGADVEVHLRLPTSFCAPNFAWLMVSDARDAVRAVPGTGRGGGGGAPPPPPHDSELINAGLAADADYRGTFGHEAEDSLDELRATFHRKAHTAAMERALTSWVRADPSRTEDDVAAVRLCDLPAGRETDSLLSRRAALGLPLGPTSPVLLTPEGTPPTPEQVALTFRKARSVRISVDGNAHFCRGLLTTRYPGSDADQVFRPSIDTALPLEVLK
jgi:hypothetical protein